MILKYIKMIIWYKDDNMIYSGNVDNAPEEIKQYEAESAKIEHKKIKITVK